MGPKEAGHSAKDMPCLETCSQRCLTVPVFTQKGEERDALTSASRVAEATIKRRSPRFFWIWKRRHQEITVTVEQGTVPNQTRWLCKFQQAGGQGRRVTVEDQPGLDSKTLSQDKAEAYQWENTTNNRLDVTNHCEVDHSSWFWKCTKFSNYDPVKILYKIQKEFKTLTLTLPTL